MLNLVSQATAILKDFKGDHYAFGSNVLDESVGKFAAELGKKAVFIGPLRDRKGK